MASHIGTGNLVGITTGIIIAGPGFLFWMWIYAFFSSIFSFIENKYAVIYQTVVNDECYSGAPYYIRKVYLSPDGRSISRLPERSRRFAGSPQTVSRNAPDEDPFCNSFFFSLHPALCPSHKNSLEKRFFGWANFTDLGIYEGYMKIN